MKLIWRVSVMAVALMGLMATTAAPVSAATYNVWGELNTGGHLVQYSTYRTHLSGSAALRIYDNTGCCGVRYSRFGLRDLNDVQITHTNQYNGDGGDIPFRRASNNSLTIPTGSYALNGRMAACSGCDRFWAGILTL